MHTGTLIAVISVGLMVGLTLALPLIQEQDGPQLANMQKTSEEMREILQRLLNPDQGGPVQRLARAARDDSSNTSEDKNNDSSSSEEKGKKRHNRSASDETSEEKDHKHGDNQKNSSSSSEEHSTQKAGKDVRRRKRDTSLEPALEANSDQLLASEEAAGQLFDDPLPNEDDYVRGCGVIEDNSTEAHNDSIE